MNQALICIDPSCQFSRVVGDNHPPEHTIVEFETFQKRILASQIIKIKKAKQEDLNKNIEVLQEFFQKKINQIISQNKQLEITPCLELIEKGNLKELAKESGRLNDIIRMVYQRYMKLREVDVIKKLNDLENTMREVFQEIQLQKEQEDDEKKKMMVAKKIFKKDLSGRNLWNRAEVNMKQLVADLLKETNLTDIDISLRYTKVQQIDELAQAIGKQLQVQSLILNLRETNVKFLSEFCKQVGQIKTLTNLNLNLDWTNVDTIEDLANCISALSALETIEMNFDYTNIHSIESLSQSIGTLSNLKRLYLYFRFTNVENLDCLFECIQPLKKLQSFYLNMESAKAYLQKTYNFKTLHELNTFYLNLMFTNAPQQLRGEFDNLAAFLDAMNQI